MKPSVNLLVKHTLKFWQFLLQNAQSVSDILWTLVNIGAT